jgi:hypothetical protein
MRRRTSPLIICMAFLWTCMITCVKTKEPVSIQPVRDPIILDELLEEDLDDLPERGEEEENKDTGYSNDED